MDSTLSALRSLDDQSATVALTRYSETHNSSKFAVSGTSWWVSLSSPTPGKVMLDAADETWR